MKFLIEIETQSTTRPTKLGGIDNPNDETLLAHGWRWADDETIPALTEGVTRSAIQWADSGDGVNAVAVYTDRPTAEITAEQYASDLAQNSAQYVLENQYILICDALRQILGQAPTQTAISEEAFPVMLLTLKKVSEPTYNTIRDAFALITGKLVTYNLKWMDTVQWHPQPELAEASNAIIGLIQ